MSQHGRAMFSTLAIGPIAAVMAHARAARVIPGLVVVARARAPGPGE